MSTKLSAFITWASKYNKAIVGFAVAAFTAYLQVHDHGVTAEEWLQVLLSGLAGGGLVWAVPNKKDPNDRN